MLSNSAEPLYIVYDGACPLCSRYMQMVRLKRSAGEVHLVNARDPGNLRWVVVKIETAGFSLDDGMAMIKGSHIAHGRDCINHLALMSTRSNIFNRLNVWIFSSPARAGTLYPIMRAGRNALLTLLGRSKIHNRNDATS